MSGPDYHAWTHRPKYKGGTDPISTDLSMCVASRTGANQTVTTTVELIYDTVTTNDPDIFRWDPADPSAVLILREGYYGFFATVRYISASIAVPRYMYQANQPLSSGYGGGFGTELGEFQFSVGQGHNQSSLGEVTSTNTIVKSTLTHIAVCSSGGSPAAPSRYAVVLGHQSGNDYTVGNLNSSSVIVRLSDYFFADAPPPDGA